jgi:predicted RNase H-like HicB family nuclease
VASRLYGTYRLCAASRLDPIDQIRHIQAVSNLDRYERLALELAEFTDLGPAEGIAARVPGFRGLIAVGKTRSLAKRELASALHEWISLALARGYGLPRVAKDREESLIER